MNPDTIRTLLDDYQDANDPRQSGGGNGDTGVRLMPHAKWCRTIRHGTTCDCHLRQYAELDRLLETMRIDRATPLLTIADDRVSLRALHWHVHHRYRRVEITSKTVRYQGNQPMGIVERPGLATSKVTPLTPNMLVLQKPASFETHVREQRHKRAKNALDVRVRLAVWHRDVRPALVDAGVVWIAHSWALTAVQPEMEEAAA